MVSLRYSFVSISMGFLLMIGIRAAVSSVFIYIPKYYFKYFILQRRWEYEPISVTGISSNDSLISFDTKIVRISRGEFGVSGIVEWNYDTTDKTMVGTKQ